MSLITEFGWMLELNAWWVFTINRFTQSTQTKLTFPIPIFTQIQLFSLLLQHSCFVPIHSVARFTSINRIASKVSTWNRKEKEKNKYWLDFLLAKSFSTCCFQIKGFRVEKKGFKAVSVQGKKHFQLSLLYFPLHFCSINKHQFQRGSVQPFNNSKYYSWENCNCWKFVITRVPEI